MTKKYVSLVLVAALLLSAGGVEVLAQTRAGEESRRGEEVRAEIARLGTGPDARIKLKLLDGRKVEGYVSEAGADTFVVVNPKSGAATAVAYPQVGTAKGNNLSQGAKIAITVAISVGLTILLYKYGRRRRRGVFF